jgi:hypothetical protein
MVGEEEIEAVKAVMESGMLAQGPRVEEFEKASAAYVGARHAVAARFLVRAVTSLGGLVEASIVLDVSPLKIESHLLSNPNRGDILLITVPANGSVP